MNDRVNDRMHDRMHDRMDSGSPAPVALPASLLRNRRLDRWIGFGADGSVEVRTGKVELGQGILTALMQIVADELDIDAACVRMRAASTATSPDEGVTSGSLSIHDSGTALRMVCAEIRALHVAEAAQRWQVDVDRVDVEGGVIVGPEGRALRYFDLADAGLLARDVEGWAAPKPSSASSWVGRSTPRIDIPDKLFGRARFIQDLDLPDMAHGRVLHPPSLDAALESADDSAARASPGVQAVHRDGRLCGVIAGSTTQVERAARRLRAGQSWRVRETLPDETALPAWLKLTPCERQDFASTAMPASGTIDRPIDRTIKASYSRPFTAHASIGPSCAIARWTDDRLEVWTHSQGIGNLRRDLSIAFAVDESAIVVQHVEGAGCYGHNGADDVAYDAAWLARVASGRPVRVLRSRAEELALSPVGPAMAVDLEADLDADGRIVAWRHAVWSNGHSGRPGRAAEPALLGCWLTERPFDMPIAANVPRAAGGGAERNAQPSYDFADWAITSHRLLEMPIRTSALRALGAVANVFAAESFMDEIALQTGVDPVAMRLSYLADPRARAVVERAVERSGWRTRPREDDVGHGIGYARYKNNGAYCAVVAEVEAGAEIRVRRLTIAADIGRVVNPDGAINQLEGGAIQATGWALKEAVRFDRDRITSDAWEHYPILKFTEVPAVDVVLMDSDAPWVGAGEGSLGPTVAAIGNAVFAALGVRVRDLPMTPDHVMAAMDAAD